MDGGDESEAKIAGEAQPRQLHPPTSLELSRSISEK